MKINDELLARYVEGSLNIEERNSVRRYLCENPKRLEYILYMMDNFDEYSLEEMEKHNNTTPKEENLSFNIAYSAAAFVPQQKKQFTSCNKRLDNTEDFMRRLGNLCEEIGM